MGFFDSLFGSKPVVPTWNSLNLGTEQQRAASNNLAIAPQAAQLANLNEQELLSMLRQVIPGLDQIEKSASTNISSMLAGQIPADVAAAIQNSGAATALGGGYAGSGSARNLVARDLGLTSLNLIDKGLSSAQSWLQTNEQMLAPAMATYQSMFVTPGQQASFDVNERNAKFQHDYLQSQINAMPDPSLVGQITVLTALASGGLSAYESGGKTVGQAGGSGLNTPNASFGGWGGNGSGGGGGGGSGSNLEGWGGSGTDSIDYSAGASPAGDYGASFGTIDNSAADTAPSSSGLSSLLALA